MPQLENGYPRLQLRDSRDTPGYSSICKGEIGRGSSGCGCNGLGPMSSLTPICRPHMILSWIFDVYSFNNNDLDKSRGLGGLFGAKAEAG